MGLFKTQSRIANYHQAVEAYETKTLTRRTLEYQLAYSNRQPVSLALEYNGKNRLMWLGRPQDNPNRQSAAYAIKFDDQIGGERSPGLLGRSTARKEVISCWTGTRRRSRLFNEIAACG
jgi:hypothetical protein